MATSLLDIRGETPPLVPISVSQFQRMIQSGILREGDPIELIDGLLVRKDRSARGENLMGHNPRHALLVSRLMRLLAPLTVSGECFLRVQLPVVLTEFNAPEPDVALVVGTEEDYTDRHPGPTDLLLVIEVADSSVTTDRSTKQRLYATAGISRYWLANIPEARVEVYEQPDIAAGAYARCTTFEAGQTLALGGESQSQVEIAIQSLFR